MKQRIALSLAALLVIPAVMTAQAPKKSKTQVVWECTIIGVGG